MEKNTVKFNNPLHMRLWLESMSFLSLERTTAWIKDETLLESCRQLYHYVTDAYDDILENPQEYGIISDIWENCREKVNFHIDILANPFRLGRDSFFEPMSVKESECLIFNKQDYDKLYKKIKNKKYNKDKIYSEDGIFEKLFNTLQRRGMVIEHKENETIIRNEKYPQMFLAAKLLNEASETFHKKMKRTPQWFINLDFRAIENPVRKPDVGDLLDPLPQTEKENAQELINFALLKNLKMDYGNLSGIRTLTISLNKQELLNMKWTAERGNRLTVMLPKPETPEHDLTLQKINQLENAEDIKDFCADNLAFCPFCGKAPCVERNAYKKKWVILGRPAKKLIQSCVSGYNENGLAMVCLLDDNSFWQAMPLIKILTEVCLNT